jgi:hypothetical protein
MLNIHCLGFDYSLVDGWHKADNTDRGQGWMDNKEHPSIVLMVDFFPENKPVSADSILEQIELVRIDRKQKANSQGLCLLEHEVVLAKNELKFIRVIEKRPQQPHGMAYTASLTLLDKAFFRITLWCFESGTTGMREAVLLDQFMRSGKFNPQMEDWGGWMIDPYGLGKQTPLMRNLSEDEKHDVRFPQHHLSQLRFYLRSLQDSLSLKSS